MCRRMGSHYHNWIDYNGVTFLVVLLDSRPRVTKMGSIDAHRIVYNGDGGSERPAAHTSKN